MKIPSLLRRSEPAVQDENRDGHVDGRDGHVDSRNGHVDSRDVPAGGPTGDGRVVPPVVTDRDDDRTTYRSSAATDDGRDPRDAEAERRAAARAATARAATGRPAEGETTRAPARRVDPTVGTAVQAPERTVDLTEDGARERPVDRGHLDRNRAAVDRTPTDADVTPTDPHRVPAQVDRTDLNRTDLDRTDLDRDADDRRAPEPAVVADRRPRSSLLATLGLVLGVAGVLFVLTGTLAGYGIAVGAVGAVLAVLGFAATRRRHVAGKFDALLGISAGLAAVVLGVLAMTGQYDWPTTDGDWVLRFREWLDSQFVDRF